MHKEINFLKKNQRNFSIEKRLKLNKSINLDNNIFYKNIKDYQWYKKSKTIASFLSIKSEIPTNGINKFLQESYKILCFPVIDKEKKGRLIFKSFSSKDKLIIGKFGTQEPLDTKECIPDIIITPCLAYDEQGYRLGYGGGYYDKTFEYLRSIKHNFVSVGLAYDDQKIKSVPHDSFDVRLNYVLTEKRLYKIL